MTKPAIDGGAAPDSGRRQRLSDLALLRIAVAPAPEREIVRDLAQYAEPPGSSSVLKAELGLAIAGLMADGRIDRDGDRLAPTETGVRSMATLAGPVMTAAAPVMPRSTEARQCLLTAWALGVTHGSAPRRKAAEKADGLRALIVEAAWGIETAGRPSASRIRSRLAVLALERAFGSGIRSGLGAKTAMSAKASRLLAGQLARKPRQHATDARLVAQLAAEAVGASRPDLALLRQGVVRRHLARGTLRLIPGPEQQATRPAPMPAVARASVEPANGEPAARPAHPVRLVTPEAPEPGPAAACPAREAFAAAVKAAAAECAEGWPGNRKAFVSHVWRLIRERHAGWRIGEIEFKSMLAEAHRLGLVVLANADLRDRRTLADIEASAVSYKNTVWHFVRVEE